MLPNQSYFASATGNSRQHNGNIHNNYTTYDRNPSFLAKLKPEELGLELLKACRDGSFKRVGRLIGSLADCDVQDSYGDTPLHVSIISGHLECITALIENGANINTKNNDGCTPLRCAVDHKAVEIVTYLIQEHANVDAADSEGNTPLACAIAMDHFEIFSILVGAAKDITTPTRDGKTALHYACERGDAHITELLTAKRTNVNAQLAKDNATPLHVALREGHSCLVPCLLDANSNITLKTRDGRNALMHAVAGADAASVRLLLGHPQVDAAKQDWQHTLRLAFLLGNTAISGLLIEKYGWSENMIEMAMQDSPGNPGMPYMEHLLNDGVDIESIFDVAHPKTWQNTKETLLFAAVRLGKVAAIKLLLKRGANRVPLVDGEMPIIAHAVAFGRLDVLRLLLQQSSSDIDVRFSERCGRVFHKTALIFAAELGKPAIVELLIKHGACIDASAKPSPRTAFTCAISRGCKFKQQSTFPNGDEDDKSEVVERITEIDSTPPYQSRERRDFELVITALLEHKASVGRQLLSVAIHHRWGTVLDLLLSAPCMSGDTESEYHPINQVDERGEPPLVQAIRTGNIGFVKRLVTTGADTDCISGSQHTAQSLTVFRAWSTLDDLVSEWKSRKESVGRKRRRPIHESPIERTSAHPDWPDSPLSAA